MLKILSLDASRETFDKCSPRYNDPPHNLKEIEEKAFAQSDFFFYHPIAIESRQVIMPDQPVICLTMYWISEGHGYGMSHDFWNGKVIFYRFGCEHREWKSGIYARHCKGCGWGQCTDSSD